MLDLAVSTGLKKHWNFEIDTEIIKSSNKILYFVGPQLIKYLKKKKCFRFDTKSG